MDQRSFELKASFPVDAQFAQTVAALAEHAATYAGCPAAEARDFANVVEQAVRQSVAGKKDESLPVVIARANGPLEVTVGTHRITWQVTPH
jgi:hypothetical protein